MQCPNCGSAVKTVPAGVSQNTGRPYNAFQVCSNRQCGWKPPRGTATPQAQVRQEQIKKEMIISYEKDIMVLAGQILATEMTAGIHPANAVGRVQEIYATLIGDFRTKIVGKYFPKPKPTPVIQEPELTDFEEAEQQVFDQDEVPF